MRISEIHGYHLGFTLPGPIGNSTGYFDRREVLLVRVVTENGISGWGETSAPHHAAGAFIKSHLAPLVLGRAVSETNAIFERMSGAQGYDRRGSAMMAISAVDMAIHDAAARERGMSVAEMLGGRLRDRAFAYASGPFMRPGADPYAAYGPEVDALLERGFRALKPRSGFDPVKDGVMANELRRRVGPDVALMVDFNQGYLPRAAIQSAKQMEGAGLLWIEEPVHPEDVLGAQLVAREVLTSISGGESLITVQSFREFLVAGTFSILQPDLGICGGFTGFRQVAGLANAFNTPVMPHVFGTIINFHAALQMAALLPARRGGFPHPYPWIEYDATFNPLMSLLGTPTLNADGTIDIPNGPGIGIELAESTLEPWLMQHWVET